MESKKSTVQKVRELAQPIADELGLFLWDVRFEKEGAMWYLRVLIDKDGGVDMNDCEAFTRPMNKALDDADPISQSYVLECGSPGLGRELRLPEHFEVCIGDVIRVRLIRPDENGEREFDTIVAAHMKAPNNVVSPCGNCRQMLFEYCPDINVIVNDENGQLVKVTARELLPYAYVEIKE